MSNSDSTPIPMKTCSCCGQTKPATAEFYHWRSDTQRFRNQCRVCRSEQQKMYSAEHHDERAAYNAAYREQHKEEAQARTRAWREANPERKRQTDKAYHLSHSEQIAQRQKTWYANNAEGQLLKKRLYRISNIERFKAKDLAYRINNPEKYRMGIHRRRAKKAGADGSHTAAELIEQRQRQENRCFYCGEELRNSDHADHLTPLSRGGSDGIENIAWACAQCNRRKGNKTEAEYRKWMLDHA